MSMPSFQSFAGSPERIVAFLVVATLILVFAIRGPLKEKLNMEKIGPVIVFFLIALAIVLINTRY